MNPVTAPCQYSNELVQFVDSNLTGAALFVLTLAVIIGIFVAAHAEEANR